ncbi:MAG: TIGR03618 family F420-dependent PPOX class oxidoreductase [Nitrososphaerota archaeon]
MPTLRITRKLIDFLSEPRVMRLATVSEDGCPHVTSVWFLYKDKSFWVSTSEDRIKVRNIAKNPCVSCIIDTDKPPYKGIIIFGRAKLSRISVKEMTLAIVKKYSPPNRVTKTFEELMRYRRVLIKITPTRVLDIMSYRKVNDKL